MITQINNLPANMAGFRATGNVTGKDFTGTVIPAVKQLVEKTGQLNYMLVLDTSVKNFSGGAWFKDAMMGIKHLTKWNRAAIVTNADTICTFTDIFPGEFKGFEHQDEQKAIDWVSGKTTF